MGSSVADGWFKDSEGHLRGIFEVKSGHETPAEALRQGAAEGTNVAIVQLKLGVSANDIVVPVVASNGYLMQFGAVIVLQPSFPAFVMLTYVLDLTKDADLFEAARMLCCIKFMVSNKLVCCTAPGRPPLRGVNADGEMQIMLSPQHYHCKLLRDFYKSTGAMQSSLYHFFKIMACLHKSIECRPFVIFPICVREYEDDSGNSAIVFPKLDSSYKIGLPNSPTLRASFLDQLKKAFAAFHKAGVVHLDPYLSNLMWRELGPNEVQLKVIDWDSAHFSYEQLSEDTLDRLSMSVRKRVHEKAPQLLLGQGSSSNKSPHEDEEEYRLKHYDISLLYVIEKYIDDPSLTVRGKGELDAACITVLERYIQDTAP